MLLDRRGAHRHPLDDAGERVLQRAGEKRRAFGAGAIVVGLHAPVGRDVVVNGGDAIDEAELFGLGPWPDLAGADVHACLELSAALGLHLGEEEAAHLVDQMLQLARLDPESGLPDPQPVDLALLAESVCADLGPQILSKNLDFDLDAAPACVVTGQADWLRVMIRNLVDNAVRYTPAGGLVRVAVSRGDDGCLFSVSDSGPGIPAEARDLVLRRFHRLDQGNQPGSGLGLAIVARIAELHGALFRLDASDITKGLFVGVQFPIR